MAQIQTVASFIAAVTALVLGVLSAKYKHKSLLLAGLVCFCIAAVGCSVSLNFPMLFLLFALTGPGMALIQPMVLALIGTHFPLEKRASAIGWFSASGSLSMVVGTPIIGIIAGLGWRWTFLSVMFPLSLVGLLVAAKGMPPAQRSHPPSSQGIETYWAGFKAVFGNRSAIACLIGNALMLACIFGILTYVPSFFRQKFLDSVEFASFIVVGGSLFFTLGTLLIGRFVTWFGRKSITAFAGIITGIITVFFMSVSNHWLAIASYFIRGLFGGMMVTIAYSLTLEQVPSYRGSMMSINSAAANVGTSLGIGIGGAVLFWWNYEFVGFSLGVLMLIAATIYYSVVHDPTRKEVPSS